jgi:hypothetical protein
MYLLLDVYYYDNNDQPPPIIIQNPSPPKILYGIAYFTFQYWFSGYLYQSGMVSRDIIFMVMSFSAWMGFGILDGTRSGCMTSIATAMGGPLIEIGLLTLSRQNHHNHNNDDYAFFFHGMGYHYTDLGETGYFPLWIVPIYFLGGPANGNLARGYWSLLSSWSIVDAKARDSVTPTQNASPCTNCNDTRCSPCPNW